MVGSEIHCGGAGAGFSFADRGVESLVENPAAGERWRWYAQSGSARLWSGADRLTIAANGNVGIGIGAGPAQRPLHVEGQEVHSGGPGGGFSFADRTSGSFVETPDAGQRWLWYAKDGAARLWSGADRLSVAANGNIGIGAAKPGERFTLGSGNILLPTANAGVDGNLYFGGRTDNRETGMRLFGGNVDGLIPGGCIDVRSTSTAEGLRIRVDTGDGGTERVRINAGGNVGIGAAKPGERLTLGSGNVLLPTANAGVDGNLYFGGRTDNRETGMRLFGGNVAGQIPGGFIDVKTTSDTEGLRIRVDTGDGGTERVRITAGGNVGIGATKPSQRLTLGSGNMLLPTATGGVDGNLYFGGGPTTRRRACGCSGATSPARFPADSST